MGKKVALKGCVLHSRSGREVRVTESQLEVLKLLAYPNCHTQETIAIKRKTSRQAVNKVVKILKNKGLYSKTYNVLEQDSKRVAFSNVSTQPKSLFRFHNMRWTLKIIQRVPNQKKKDWGLEKTQFTFDGNKVKVWEHSIEIYSKKHFLGDTTSEAYNNAIEYWYKFFVKLENRCNAILLKDQYQNIQLTKCELANTENEIAKDYILQGKKFKICDSEGVVWALIDNSHGLFEFETVNAKTVKPDMDNIQEVMNNYRDNPEIKKPLEVNNDLLQITATLKEIVKTNKTNSDLSNQRLDRIENLLGDVVQTMNKNNLVIEGMIKEIENIKKPSWLNF